MNKMAKYLFGATICGAMLLSPASDAEESKPTDPVKGRTMTTENTHIKQWGNLFGPAAMESVAEEDPVFNTLLQMEMALS